MGKEKKNKQTIVPPNQKKKNWSFEKQQKNQKKSLSFFFTYFPVYASMIIPYNSCGGTNN